MNSCLGPCLLCGKPTCCKTKQTASLGWFQSTTAWLNSLFSAPLDWRALHYDRRRSRARFTARPPRSQTQSHHATRRAQGLPGHRGPAQPRRITRNRISRRRALGWPTFFAQRMRQSARSPRRRKPRRASNDDSRTLDQQIADTKVSASTAPMLSQSLSAR